MQKSTLLTRAHLAEGTSNVKQASKNKKPKIIAVAPNLYLRITEKDKNAGCWSPTTT